MQLFWVSTSVIGLLLVLLGQGVGSAKADEDGDAGAQGSALVSSFAV